MRAKKAHPESPILAHPECREEVLALADYAGSTSGILRYAAESPVDSFIVCTEKGILYPLQQENPSKHFYFVDGGQICQDMKRITPQKILNQLQTMTNVVTLDTSLSANAGRALDQMLSLAK
jgi:quinolinate synthase